MNTTTFSLLKEKIIKTDTLLQMYSRNKDELSHIKQLYNRLLKKIVHYKGLQKRIECDRDRLQFNYDDLHNKYNPLQSEYTRLKAEFSTMEQGYFEKVNTLQIKYQDVNRELELHLKEKNNISEACTNKLEDLLKKEEMWKAEMEKLTLKIADYDTLDVKLRDLQLQNENLNEINNKLATSLELERQCKLFIETEMKKLEASVQNYKSKITLYTNDLHKVTELMNDNERLKDTVKYLESEMFFLTNTSSGHNNIEFETLPDWKTPIFNEDKKEVKTIDVSQCYDPSLSEVRQILNEMRCPSLMLPITQASENGKSFDSVNNSVSAMGKSNLSTDQKNKCIAKISDKTVQESKRKRIKYKQNKQSDVRCIANALLLLKRANLKFSIHINSNCIKQRNRLNNIKVKKTKFKYVKPQIFVRKFSPCSQCDSTGRAVINNQMQLLGFCDISNVQNSPLNYYPYEESSSAQVIKKFPSNEVYTCTNNKELPIEHQESPKILHARSKRNKQCTILDKFNEYSKQKRIQESTNCIKTSYEANLDVEMESVENCSQVESCINNVFQNSEKLLTSHEITSTLKAFCKNTNSNVIKHSYKRPTCATRKSERLMKKELDPFYTTDAIIEPLITSANITANVLGSCEKAETKSICTSTCADIEYQSHLTTTVQCNQSVFGEMYLSTTKRTNSSVGNKSVAPSILHDDKICDNANKMYHPLPDSKIRQLFNKLINYSAETEVSNEVAQEFSGQDSMFVARAVLNRLLEDVDNPSIDENQPFAPLLTLTQKVMLGFLLKMEKLNVANVVVNFLLQIELRILTNPILTEIKSLTIMYVAICKLRDDLDRMRKFCCEVFYFCDDYAIPFFFTVLISWSEVLPSMSNLTSTCLLPKVLVQIIYTKTCNEPGFSLLPLRDLLIKFYDYPSERWDAVSLFSELVEQLQIQSSRVAEFSILLLCKNSPDKWVYENINTHFMPLLVQDIDGNNKLIVLNLIGYLLLQFDNKATQMNQDIVTKLHTLLRDTTVAPTMKTSIELWIQRLACT